MLRAIAREAFEWLFIFGVLVGAVLGVALYVTVWLVLFPLRLAAAPRGSGGEVQALQDFGAGPCAAPTVHTLPAARALSKAA